MRAVIIKDKQSPVVQPERQWCVDGLQNECVYIATAPSSCVAYGLSDTGWVDADAVLSPGTRLYVMDDGTLRVEHP